MSWADVTTYGSGFLRFAIVIEGWPEIWVTDSSITLTDGTFGARGRSVRTGLLRDGLRFTERADLAQGKFTADSMRIRCVSADEREHALASFGSVGQSAGILATDLEADDTTITLLAPVAADGYYHVGTEVIYIDLNESEPGLTMNITRAHWDTQAQSFIQVQDNELMTHRVYGRPRTAEGRRVTLYVWGDTDDATGYDPEGEEITMGRPIWRGIISVPPQLERDNQTWAISADHISTVFRQQLCARNDDIKVTGIWHPSDAPLYVYTFDPDNGTRYDQRAHVFWVGDVVLLQTKSVEIFANLLAETDSNLGDFFTDMHLVNREDGVWVLRGHTVASPGDYDNDTIHVGVISHLCGGLLATTWKKVTNNHVVDGTNGTFQANSVYEAEFSSQPQPPVNSTATLFGWWNLHGQPRDEATFTRRLGVSHVMTDSEIEDYDSHRLYIDRDWSGITANALSVDQESLVRPESFVSRDESKGALTLTVTDSGFDADYGTYFIRVIETDRPDSNIFHGWATSEAVIVPVYATDEPTDVVGLINNLVERAAQYSNDGNVPFIRDTDFDLDTEIIHSVPEVSASRNYAFSKPVAVEDVIAEELKLTASMLSTRAQDAKPTFVRMPIITGTSVVTFSRAIDRTTMQTPENGNGAWPSYELQSQGIATMVHVKDLYDSIEDDHNGTQRTVADANLLSSHKRRGLLEITIAPKSTRGSGQALTQGEAISIAAPILAVLGREYFTTQIPVPFSMFYAMIGDIVSVTASYLPNANGTRGVTNKRCMVIAREWNLDSGQNRHGVLTLLGLLEDLSGYTPSGMVSGYSGAGVAFTLLLGAFPTLGGDDINALISPRGDGDVASTFAIGDAIRIVQFGVASPTIIQGTVTAVGVGSVSVAFVSPWTPGANVWALEYDGAATATTAQKLYAFVAGADGLINGADQARSFS